MNLTAGTIEHLESRIDNMGFARLRDTADNIHSIWRRYGESRIVDGMYRADCITCARRYPVAQMDAGHWQKRAKLWVRWYDPNVWPQCKRCNNWGDGEPEKFQSALQAMGVNTEELIELSRKPGKPSDDDIRELILWCGTECISRGFDIGRVTYPRPKRGRRFRGVRK